MDLLPLQYVWFVWSLLLLAVWLAVYFFLSRREEQREMLVVSLTTSLLGLTEPLFVPEYWSPPSLFDLALRTGFDLESLIFSFAIGGLAFALYGSIFRGRHVAMSPHRRHLGHHRFHLWALLTAPAILVGLLLATNLNPLHSAIIAMIAGGLATWYCRPDLKLKMVTSAFLFLGLYFVYFWTLIVIAPIGYVEQVWNLAAISGVLILGIPLEELLFALSFGFIWSSVYEHFTWRRLVLDNRDIM